MKEYTSEELLTELNRITDMLGHAPSYEEVRSNSNIAPRTFQRRLGKTWEDVKRCVGWKSQYELFNPVTVSAQEGSWLSGFIDGEGCFRMARPSPGSGGGLSKSYTPIFCVSLRDDDGATLQEFCRILGIGCQFRIDKRISPSHKDMKNAHPAYKIFIRDLPTLAYHLIPILNQYPLRSKKSRELPVFKLAVQTLLNKRTSNRINRKYTDEERSLLDRVYLALHDLKQYKSDYDEIVKKYNLPL